MKKQHVRAMHVSVGMLMILSVLAFWFLVMKVSGMADVVKKDGYRISANFTDIGGLKVRAPVTIAGVKIGEVSQIDLQPLTLNAKVTMTLRQNVAIPYEDASARILTQGLLGSNYISIVPGYDDTNPKHPFLRGGDTIAKTQEAVILENIIGQFLFNIKK
jgi:phospholipid/cholesterol/gamma-HCH transport system substrate-binding protein